MAFLKFHIVPDPDGPGPSQDDTIIAIIAFLLIVAGAFGLLKVAGVW